MSRICRSPLTLALLAAVAAAAAPATASAEPDWLAPRALPIGSDQSYTNSAFVAFDRYGTATYGTTNVLGASPLTTITRLLNGPAGAPLAEQLTDAATPDGTPLSARVAVGPDGAAAACLTELSGTDPATDPLRYRVTYRPAGSATWDAPAAFVADTVHDSHDDPCRAVVGADGTAAVTVRRTTADAEPRRSQVFLTVHRPGQPWSAAEALSPDDRTGDEVEAGVADKGDVTVAWDERYAGTDTATTADDLTAVKVATRHASSSFTDWPHSLTPEATEDAGAPRLAVDQDGSAIVAFRDDATPGKTQVWASLRTGGRGTWSPSQQLVSDAASSSSPVDVAIAPDHTIYVAYWRGGTVDQLGMRRTVAGGPWTAEQPVGPTGITSAGGRLAFTGNDAMLVYDGSLPGTPSTHLLEAVRWRAGADAPEAARDLLEPGTTAQLDDVGTDGQGGVFALVLTPDPRTPYGIHQAIPFDAGPPRATTVDIPAFATAGVPLGMGVVFADQWSSVGPVRWDFGDGVTETGTAPGSTALHAFAAPGSYTVTARVADALGNERTVTKHIIVRPAHAVPAAKDATRPVVTLTLPSCPKRLSASQCRRRRASRTLWRTLRGTVSDEGGSGVDRIEVSVARRVGKRRTLQVYDGKRFKTGTLSRFRNGAVRARLSGTRWSRSLGTLAQGTYLLRIRAYDRAGNASRLVTRTMTLR